MTSSRARSPRDIPWCLYKTGHVRERSQHCPIRSTKLNTAANCGGPSSRAKCVRRLASQHSKTAHRKVSRRSLRVPCATGIAEGRCGNGGQSHRGITACSGAEKSTRTPRRATLAPSMAAGSDWGRAAPQHGRCGRCGQRRRAGAYRGYGNAGAGRRGINAAVKCAAYGRVGMPASQ